MLSQLVAGELKHILEKDPWKLAAGFLQTSHNAAFPFVDFTLCSFTAINHSREHYMLGPGSPSKPSNLEWSWRPPAQSRKKQRQP